MILVARIEDIRSSPDGRLSVTASYWADSTPFASGNVSALCAIGPASDVRAAVIAACIASAETDFGVDPSSIASATVL
jgi:hypothetical protein